MCRRFFPSKFASCTKCKLYKFSFQGTNPMYMYFHVHILLVIKSTTIDSNHLMFIYHINKVMIRLTPKFNFFTLIHLNLHLIHIENKLCVMSELIRVHPVPVTPNILLCHSSNLPYNKPLGLPYKLHEK